MRLSNTKTLGSVAPRRRRSVAVYPDRGEYGVRIAQLAGLPGRSQHQGQQSGIHAEPPGLRLGADLGQLPGKQPVSLPPLPGIDVVDYRLFVELKTPVFYHKA